MTPVSFGRRAASLLALLLLFTSVNSYGQDAATAAPSDASADYRISPLDVLTISVVNEKDLTMDCKVSSSGTITYQWLSNVDVVGKTTTQIELILREALDKDYLVNPTVLVALKEYRLREVNVYGQVNKPGPVIIPPERPMSVVEAITKAGALTARGNPNKIDYTPKRTGKKIPLRMDELLRVTDPAKTIYVEPGDTIEVGEKVL